MRAIVKAKPGPGLSVMDMADPVPDNGEVVLAMRYAGVCGSDLATFRWEEQRRHLGTHLPMILGHEGVGVVEAVGSGVSTLQPGDRVVPEPLLACGGCRYCRAGRQNLCQRGQRLGTTRPGMMAVRVAVPERACWKVPDVMGDQDAALMEVATVAMHGIRRIGDVAGRRVSVVGPGSVGLCTVILLKALGAASIVLIGRPSSVERLRIGADLGASETVWVDDETDIGQVLGDRAELAFETAGSAAAVECAIKSVAAGGRVLASGGFSAPLALDFQRDVRSREVDILGSRGRTSEDWHLLLAMITGGAVGFDGIPKQVFPLGEIDAAMDAVVAKTAVKVLLECAA